MHLIVCILNMLILLILVSKLNIDEHCKNYNRKLCCLLISPCLTFASTSFVMCISKGFSSADKGALNKIDAKYGNIYNLCT